MCTSFLTLLSGGKFRTVGEDVPLVLDGSSSLDPNKSPLEEQYSWDCEEKETGYPCFFKNSSNSDIEERLLLADNARVEIAPGLLAPNMS